MQRNRKYLCVCGIGGSMMNLPINVLNKSFLLKLNLQNFADDPEGGGQDEPPADLEKLELTADELQKKIEAESDRKLASALQKKRGEWESELQTKIDDALKEKDRLSKLSDKERKDEELSQREKDIAKRLAEIERKELKADAIADLTQKELPTSFADFLLAEDAESTLKNINDFKTAFDEAVNAAVKEKLRQETPIAGTGSFTNGKVPSVANLAQEHRLIK